MVNSLMATAKARLRSAIRRGRSAEKDRDDAIVDMRAEGEKLTDIADTAEMSIEGVRKILHRRGVQ